MVNRIGERGAAICAILTALTLTLVLGSNLRDIWAAQDGLGKSIAQQEAALKANQTVETQLEKLAAGTQKLADQGNPNAQRIVGLLKQNGITINAK
ncbi:MAG: hypothetical protein JSR79_08680 [Proteobacteria bacterium]|nr:hypothetical protein [Pseudomonadota bacterium]